METLIHFVQSNKPYIDMAHALSSLINIIGWLLGGILLWVAWRRNSIKSFQVGPVNFQMQEAAIEATATAARDWQSKAPAQTFDLGRIRETVGRAFRPAVIDNLTGRSILWVDDRPANNALAVRALRKFHLDVEEVLNTEAALAAMSRRHFDLVISDMGRGDNNRAGYELLDEIRRRGSMVPFLIFSSSDKPEHRQEAMDRGAQLATNSIIELLDYIIKDLGERDPT